MFPKRCFFATKEIEDKKEVKILVLVLQITQIVVGVVLIMLILIQAPRTGGMGVIGGMAQVFSSQSSATSWITKVTMWSAGIFLVVSFIIGIGIIK